MVLLKSWIASSTAFSSGCTMSANSSPTGMIEPSSTTLSWSHSSGQTIGSHSEVVVLTQRAAPSSPSPHTKLEPNRSPHCVLLVHSICAASTQTLSLLQARTGPSSSMLAQSSLLRHSVKSTISEQPLR